MLVDYMSTRECLPLTSSGKISKETKETANRLVCLSHNFSVTCRIMQTSER